MGYVSHKLLLIVLGTGDFVCHIRKGCAQIADLVLTVNLKLIVHVPGGKLLRSLSNPAQGKINHFRKEDQNDQGQQKKDHQHQVGNI